MHYGDRRNILSEMFFFCIFVTRSAIIMKIVIEKGSEGGVQLTRAPDFSEMSGGAKKFRDDRTTKYLR